MTGTNQTVISNDEVKRFFKKYPHKLYDISPRKFEELIATILEDLGFSVELTQATHDGGRDIIAHIKNAVTDFLAYVECKNMLLITKLTLVLLDK